MRLRAAASVTVLVLAAALLGLVYQTGSPTRIRLDMVAVSIGDRLLLVSRHEVSIAEWQLCYDDGGCSFNPKPGPGAAGTNFPVTGVNWFDVNEYLAWSRQNSDLQLRLPTLAEWNMIAQDVPLAKQKKLFTDPRLAWAANYSTTAIPPRLKTSGSFKPSQNGIADLSGNVWEWTMTCVSSSFTDQDAERCPAYIAAGEHEATIPVFVRDPANGGCAVGAPPAHLGFRLVVEG